MAKSRKGRVILIAPSQRSEIRYLDRLEREPTAKTKAEMNAVLDYAFYTSQAYVHVLSGRLRSSGRKSSSSRRTVRMNEWRGSIEYGRGIDYAHYEFDNYGERSSWPIHPSHDPLEGLSEFYMLMDMVVEDVF